MRRVIVVVIVFVVGTVVYFGTRGRLVQPQKTGDPKPTTSASAKGRPAPALNLTDLNGSKINTSNYKGKVVLVNFWAAWCTPCAAEVPQLIAMHDKYRDQGFEVIGFSMEDQEKVLRDFCAKNKVDYPVVVGNQEIAQAYGGILGLPTSILIDREGNIRSKYPGLADVSKLEQEVVALLKEQK